MPAFSGGLRNVNVGSGDRSIPVPQPTRGNRRAAVAPIFLPRATSFAIGVTRPRDVTDEGPPLASLADNTPEPSAPISSVTAAPTPRDWSALRSDNPHPWRSLRRCKRRMHPRSGRWLDRPDTIHEALVASISVPMPPALPVPPPIPVPSPVPPAPTSIKLVDAAPLGLAFHILPDLPENTTPSHATPIDSEFGPITSPLALACALGLGMPLFAVDNVCISIWGSECKGWQLHAVWTLPTDFRIFITVISQIVCMHHEFAAFFEAPLIAFLEAWMEHYLRLGR